jgi:hypothetical protein
LYHACPKGATPHNASPFLHPPHWLPAWRRGTRLVSVTVVKSVIPYRVMPCWWAPFWAGISLNFLLNPSIAHFIQAPWFVVPCPSLGHYTFPSCQEFILCPLLMHQIE